MAYSIGELSTAFSMLLGLLDFVLRKVGIDTIVVRVQVSGFRVQGSGFRVSDLGFRFQGFRFRAQISGFRVSGFTGLV